jgi:hypothetical protein
MVEVRNTSGDGVSDQLRCIGAKNIQGALKRILGIVRQQNFNCLEVAGIVAKRFLGVRAVCHRFRTPTSCPS